MFVWQGYRSHPTSTGWQWTSGSAKETLWNMNEEIHTCFQVTKAVPWRWQLVCVCVCVYLRRRMHKQRNFLALPVQTLCGDESSCQPCWLNETDIIWPGEAAWQSLGLSSEQVPCIYNLLRTLRMETGQSRPNWAEGGRGDSVEGGAQRHLHRSCPQVLSIYFCKYESNVEGL